MRFIFAWQHVAPSSHLSGLDGLTAIIEQLDGYEVAAGAWERSVLPSRLDRYDAALVCNAGIKPSVPVLDGISHFPNQSLTAG